MSPDSYNRQNGSFMTVIPCVTEEVAAPAAVVASPNPCPIQFTSLMVLLELRLSIASRLLEDTMDGKYTGAIQKLQNAFNITEAGRVLERSLRELDDLQSKYDCAYARNEFASIVGDSKDAHRAERDLASLHWQMANLREQYIEPAADHIWSLIARA